MKAPTTMTILLGTIVWHANASAQSRPSASPNVTVAPAFKAEVVHAALPPLSESLRGQARAEYIAARLLYEDGDYAGSLAKLATAHQLSADPRLLWNMAAAEKNLRHYSNVIDYTERFLAAGPPYTTDEDRLQAQQLLAAVSGLVSAVTFNVQPAGVRVEVDGHPVGTSPIARTIRIDFGRHEVHLSKAKYRSEMHRLDLEGGKPTTLNAFLSEDVHEGTLKVVTDPNTTIRIDGRLAGIGLWQAEVASGTHTVQLEVNNKILQTTEVVVSDGETRTLSLPLSDLGAKKQSGVPIWLWIAGGVAVAGLGVGMYLLLHESHGEQPIQQGSWGTLEF